MRTIRIVSCHECPLNYSDADIGGSYCQLSEGNDWIEDLPKEGVHKDCPLRKESYKLKLLMTGIKSITKTK